MQASGEHASPGNAALRIAARRLAQGELESATDAIEAEIQVNPDSTGARFLLGLLAWRLANHADAIDQVKAAHEAAPRNGTYVEALASLYAQVGELQESLYYGKLATALGLDDATADFLPPDFPSFGQAFLGIDDHPLARAARRLEQFGDFANAVGRLEQHLRVAPGDLPARRRMTELLIVLDRPGEAALACVPLLETESPADMSLAAMAFAGAGVLDHAKLAHEAAVTFAPEDPVIAGRQVADARWYEPDTDALAEVAWNWVERFCPPRETSPSPRREGKIRIGMLVAGALPPGDRAAVADLARAFDRSRVVVHGFGLGDMRWPHNALLRGAFDRWRDISRLDLATLALMLDRENLDAVIDATGFSFPLGPAALARTRNCLRLGWIGAPAFALPGLYDRVIAPASAAGGDSFILDSGAADIAMPAERLSGSRAQPGGAFQIGLDLQPRHLSQSMLTLLAGLLDAVPDSQLALRDGGLSHGVVSERLIEALGRERVSRVNLLTEPVPEFYSQLGLAVAPLGDSSARAAIDALAQGTPVLAWCRPGDPRNAAAAAVAAVLPDCVVAAPEQLPPLAAAIAADRDRHLALRQAAETAARSDRFIRRPLADAITAAVAAHRG